MEGLGFRFRAEASLTTLTADVIKSSAIEGEYLDAEAVRSSLARRLGLDIGGTSPSSRNVEGIVEMMLDATQKFADPLTVGRLFAWHDQTEAAHRAGTEVAQHIAAMLTTMCESIPPAIAPGEHCSKPYPCPFWEHCTRHRGPILHAVAEAADGHLMRP